MKYGLTFIQGEFILNMLFSNRAILEQRFSQQLQSQTESLFWSLRDLDQEYSSLTHTVTVHHQAQPVWGGRAVMNKSVLKLHACGHTTCRGVQLIPWPDFQQQEHVWTHCSSLSPRFNPPFTRLGRRHGVGSAFTDGPVFLELLKGNLMDWFYLWVVSIWIIWAIQVKTNWRPGISWRMGYYLILSHRCPSTVD